MAGSQFHWLDYVLFFGTIVGALAIGVYNAFSAAAKKSSMDYLTGSRQMTVIPIALSIMMSGFSSISVLGNTAEMYFHGTQMFWTSTAGCIGSYLSTHLFVPIYYNLKAITCFQYFDWRYDSMVLRRLASAICIALWLFYAGACAYAPSIALAGITTIPLWVGIVCTAVIGTIYTAIGGIRAVVWTDAFQAVVLFTGILAVVIVGAIEVGGLQRIFEIADEGGRIRFFDMTVGITRRTSFWSCTIPFLIGTHISALHDAGISIARYWHQRCTVLASALHGTGISIARDWHQCCMLLVSALAHSLNGCGLEQWAWR